MLNRRMLRRPSLGVQTLATGLSIALLALLGAAALHLDNASTGLTETVAERVDESGVSNPVTAVLLNFRAYDTWLEVAVLLLAVLGALVLRQSTRVPEQPVASIAGSVLGWLTRLLVPAAVVIGIYLLWKGTAAPGGAFQGGAVLGAAGILLRLSGYRSIGLLRAWVLRLSLLAGFGVFLVIATALYLAGYGFLTYPSDRAGILILLIELFITGTVAVSFVALLIAARPRPEAEPGTDARDGGSV